MKYLPPVWPKMLPKLKMLKIYWNLTHSIFEICQSWFSCQKWFLLNIYHLLDPNWSQNWKCSGFIDIWHIWYFEYPNLDFDIKNYFLWNIYQLLGSNWKFDKNWNLVKIFDKNYFLLNLKNANQSKQKVKNNIYRGILKTVPNTYNGAFLRKYRISFNL